MDKNERNERREHSQRLGALVQGTLCVAVLWMPDSDEFVWAAKDVCGKCRPV